MISTVKLRLHGNILRNADWWKTCKSGIEKFPSKSGLCDQHYRTNLHDHLSLIQLKFRNADHKKLPMTYRIRYLQYFVVQGPAAALRLIVQPCDKDNYDVFFSFFLVIEHRWNERQWKTSTRRKTFPSATLSTTNLTWTDPGSNPDLCGERPATNRLSHGITCSYSMTYRPDRLVRGLGHRGFAKSR
jgi:hypothetical protein